jgi:hypothetical protein
MLIKSKRKCLVQYSVIGCDYCGKPIGNSNMVVVALKMAQPGINDRKQWVAKKAQEHFHRKCFHEKTRWLY